MLYAKVDRLAGKIYFVQKILKIMDSFSDMLTLENAGRQWNDTRSTFRVILKTSEYNGNWLCGRSVASEWSPKLFFVDGKGNHWKTEIFTLWPVTWKRREILGWAIKGEKAGIHRGTNTFWAKIGCGAVLTLFWSLKVGRGRLTAIR